VELVLVSHGRGIVVADGARLGQLVETLAAAALLQTPPGGRIEVGAVALGDRAVLTVTAPGSELAIPGSGLALAVARAIAEAHGGSIALAAERGGTTLTVTVPTHVHAEEAA
jgi:signal transduction histidine kinase